MFYSHRELLFHVTHLYYGPAHEHENLPYIFNFIFPATKIPEMPLTALDFPSQGQLFDFRNQVVI